LLFVLLILVACNSNDEQAREKAEKELTEFAKEREAIKKVKDRYQRERRAIDSIRRSDSLKEY
jgi:hypothetical protein